MKIPFTKMHGLGNDFVVINTLQQPAPLNAAVVRHISNRHTGIGCDQLLLVQAPTHPDADFDYRIFNADGGEVEHCGNGVRCFARFVREQGLTDKTRIPIHSRAGLIAAQIEDDGQVTVAMGIPMFEPQDIPFVARQRQHHYALEVAGQTIHIGAVALGNPHAVIDTGDIDRAGVATIGPQVEAHQRFPQRVNVGFRQCLSRTHLRLRVFERGVGETLACGTGACAAVALGNVQGLLEHRVRVSLPGGDLMVHWRDRQQIMLTGPASTVYQGIIEL